MKTRYRHLLGRVEREDGHTPSLAAYVLLKDTVDDAFVADLVETVLRADTPTRDRAEAMCRLLGTYGVGSVVKGRLV